MHPSTEERDRNALTAIALCVRAVERGAATPHQAMDAIAQVVGATADQNTERRTFGFSQALEANDNG